MGRINQRQNAQQWLEYTPENIVVYTANPEQYLGLRYYGLCDPPYSVSSNPGINLAVINLDIKSPVRSLQKPRIPSRLHFLSWRFHTRFDPLSTNPFLFITRRLNFGRTLNTFPDPVSTKLEISRFGTTLG